MQYYPDPARAAISHQFKLGIEYRRISDFINKDLRHAALQGSQKHQSKYPSVKERRVYKPKATSSNRNEQGRKGKEGLNV